MKQLKLLLLILFCSTFYAFGQEGDYAKEVGIYLNRNHSLDQYGYAYEQLLTMLESQYPKSDANAEAWKYLETNKEKKLAEMKALLVPIYLSNFSQPEIQGMISFYESDTGKQLAVDRSKMTEPQKEELNVFYNSELGAKIIERQQFLTQEIGMVSESWSRDLYETAVTLLEN